MLHDLSQADWTRREGLAQHADRLITVTIAGAHLRCRTHAMKLAHSRTRNRVTMCFEKCVDLGCAIPTMPTKCADAVEFARLGPSGDGLGINTEQRSNLCGRQEMLGCVIHRRHTSANSFLT